MPNKEAISAEFTTRIDAVRSLVHTVETLYGTLLWIKEDEDVFNGRMVNIEKAVDDMSKAVCDVIQLEDEEFMSRYADVGMECHLIYKDRIMPAVNDIDYLVTIRHLASGDDHVVKTVIDAAVNILLVMVWNRRQAVYTTGN